MKHNFKPLTKKERDEIEAEMAKGFDFEKATRRGVFMNLDDEILEYFKALSAETGRGYQVLIQEALYYFKENKMKPRTVWEKAKE